MHRVWHRRVELLCSRVQFGPVTRLGPTSSDHSTQKRDSSAELRLLRAAPRRGSRGPHLSRGHQLPTMQVPSLREQTLILEIDLATYLGSSRQDQVIFFGQGWVNRAELHPMGHGRVRAPSCGAAWSRSGANLDSRRTRTEPGSKPHVHCIDGARARGRHPSGLSPGCNDAVLTGDRS